MDPRPLRILHTEASLGWGGQEIRILTEAQAMMRRGHQLMVACPESATLFQRAAGYGVPVTSLAIERKSVTALMGLVRYLRRYAPDVLVTHSSVDSWLGALAVRLLRPRIPLVRVRHLSALPPQNGLSRWLYARGANHVVTTGLCIKEQLQQRFRIDPQRVTSIPTGIDLDDYRPRDRQDMRRQLGRPADLFLIGIVATLRSWKGHLDLLTAFQRVIRQSIQPAQLLIIGDGPNRPAIERAMVQLDMTASVSIVGHQTNISSWLNALDLFVLPSYANEGVPQALLQAMACGLPVIASRDVGAIGEVVTHQQTGWLTPARDPEQLADAMVMLMQDAGLRQRLGQAARDAVHQHASLEQMCQQMEKIFLDVIIESSYETI
ncbi:MAG: glycosyltransferase family 4 protein [Magnetococcales bacterium]|nr:glycosyltransferase family 4 protein [Magnetococcales bacterium]